MAISIPLQLPKEAATGKIWCGKFNRGAVLLYKVEAMNLII